MKMKVIAIYKITNLVNGKIYVGSSKNAIRRMKAHVYKLNLGIHPNKPLQASWILHGEDAFVFSILEQLKYENELIASEQYWLDFTKCYIDGYNIRSKAESNYKVKVSDETKAKIAKAGKGRIVSPETRLKISQSQIGREFSEDHKFKLSEAGKGKRLGNTNAIRKLNLWPCADGWKCRCVPCGIKRNEQKYASYKRAKLRVSKCFDASDASIFTYGTGICVDGNKDKICASL